MFIFYRSKLQKWVHTQINGYNGNLYDLVITNSLPSTKYKNKSVVLSGNSKKREKNYCYKVKYVDVHFLNEDSSYVYDFVYTEPYSK